MIYPHPDHRYRSIVSNEKSPSIANLLLSIFMLNYKHKNIKFLTPNSIAELAEFRRAETLGQSVKIRSPDFHQKMFELQSKTTAEIHRKVGFLVYQCSV